MLGSIFKKAKMFDLMVTTNESLKKELTETQSQNQRLTKKYETLQNKNKSLTAELNDALAKLDNDDQEACDCSEEVCYYSEDRVIPNPRISELVSMIDNYKTSINHKRLCEFVNGLINEPVDVDKMTNSEIDRLYYYLKCINDVSSYLSKNNLRIRKN